MAKYKITFKRSAAKELYAIPGQDLNRILKRIEALATDPRPHGSQKLSNSELYRIRQGDYRVVYLILDDVIEVQVIKIGHRREVYSF